MRDQFYGDRKDVLKWTLALRLAGTEKRVLYVVMYRPCKGSHGCDFRTFQSADSRVVVFFEEERKRFQSGVPRCVRDITRLLPGRIELIDGKYEHRERKGYFDAVRNPLIGRGNGERYIILLDPDNGISGKCSKSEHVCADELSAMRSAMVPGDVLLVYQHRFRDKGWASKRQEALVLATKVSADAITCHRRRDVADVCFFAMALPG
jgi:hypothetical protein